MKELLLEIWTSVRKNKLRTALTGFSVAWGIFMLVILLGSGNGLKHGVISNFGNYATNSIDLYGGRTSMPYMGYQKGRRIRLRNNDLEILKKEFPEVLEVAANSWFSSKTVTYNDQFMTATLRGALPLVEKIEGVEIVAGRFLNESDITGFRKVVVIDEGMRTILFKGNDPLGCQLKFGSSVFTVIGVYKADANRTSSTSYIPLSTGQLIYNANNPEVNNVIITVQNVDTDQAMTEFERRILHRLAAEHHYDPEDQSAIWIENTMERHKDMMTIFNGISLFVWIIGLGTLLAGVVGVSNIMLVTVRERTFEFGIRKALGARPSSIIRLILTESVLVTASFGYIGMVLGVAVMEGVNYVLTQSVDESNFTIFKDPTLDLSIVFSATIVLVLAGLVAGYIPARRAAQLKTIDALRYNK